MNLELPITILLFLLNLVYWRQNIDGWIDLSLNRSARKKRKRGQNIVDWLLYRRFRDIVPKSLMYAYYVIPSLHLLVAFCSVVAFVFQWAYASVFLCIVSCILLFPGFLIDFLAKSPNGNYTTRNYNVIYGIKRTKKLSQERKSHFCRTLIQLLLYVFVLVGYIWYRGSK